MSTDMTSRRTALLENLDGFRVEVFAGEPMVRQPIDTKVDARGRVWVAEARQRRGRR